MSRSHETIIDIKATPEEVFRGVTDPVQIVKWFSQEATVDPRVGGEYTFGWGEIKGSTTITAFDPYTHFGTASQRSKTYGAKGMPVETGVMQTMAVDYYIEAIGDGVTRLRLVQSGFGGEAWDGEFESTKSGWASFVAKLKEVLEA